MTDKLPSPFDCPESGCLGTMRLLQFVEDYDFDWEGNIEHDDDGFPLLVEYAVYECDTCQHCERRFHRWLEWDGDRS